MLRLLTSTFFFLFPSLRMIQELTKRTPCSLPAASFPLQRPARTTWSTTRTSDRSRNPKWGGRNEYGPARTNRLTFVTVVYAVSSPVSDSLHTDERPGDVSRDQQLCLLNAGTSTAVGFLYTDFYGRIFYFFLLTVIFPATPHFEFSVTLPKQHYSVTNHTGIQSFCE